METQKITMKPKEIEEIVVRLARDKVNPAKIGLILRDQHGIPKAKLLGKKITKILKDNGINSSPDRECVTKRIEELKKHTQENKQDKKAKRALQILEARLRKIGIYEKLHK